MTLVQDTVTKLEELTVENQRLGQLYRKIFPKVDPSLVYDLISRLDLDPKSIAPVYTVEVFTKDGTGAEKSRDHIMQTTGTVPSIYDNNTHYVSTHRLTLEILKKLNDIDYVLEVMGDYNGGMALFRIVFNLISIWPHIEIEVNEFNYDSRYGPIIRTETVIDHWRRFWIRIT